MTPVDFCYWLQGYFEIENPKELDEKQTQIVKDHLELVFTKITPDYSSLIKIEKDPNKKSGSDNFFKTETNLVYYIPPGHSC